MIELKQHTGVDRKGNVVAFPFEAVWLVEGGKRRSIGYIPESKYPTIQFIEEIPAQSIVADIKKQKWGSYSIKVRIETPDEIRESA